MMLGFACICKSLGQYGSFRKATIKGLSALSDSERLKKLKAIAVDNLYRTAKILEWCAENNIGLYRMSSELIPLPNYYTDWLWWLDDDVLQQCRSIKELSAKHHIQISMHPDQFCVLNSDKEAVVANSIEILEYHNTLSNLTGNKLLILHVGSAAGGKEAALERFKASFKLLSKDIQQKLVLENDDKKFSVLDVLTLCEDISIPMLIDLHHHRCCNQNEDIFALRERIKATWKDKKPKLHLSSGREHKLDRSHSDFIKPEDFAEALKFAGEDFNVMLECKEKDFALLRLRSI